MFPSYTHAKYISELCSKFQIKYYIGGVVETQIVFSVIRSKYVYHSDGI